jgi:hypothetical protein
MARIKPRGLPTDSNFSDEVVEDLGRPILSGGGYSDNVIINEGGGSSIVNPGTGGTFLDLKKGCTDRTATNYNPNATVDNGTCKYIKKETKVLSESRNLSVNITSNKGGSILINGKDTLKTTAKIFNYTGKELLTPQYFKIIKSGFTSNDEYKLYSTKKKFTKTIKPLIEQFDDDFIDFDERIPITNDNDTYRGFGEDSMGVNFNSNNSFNTGLRGDTQYLGFSRPIEPKIRMRKPIVGFVEYDYYEFRLEKNGVSIPVLDQINKITDTITKTQQLTLAFDLNDVIIDDDEPVSGTEIKVNIEGYVSANDIIQYQTSWGESGFVIDEGDINLKYTPNNNKANSFIKFISVGISDFTHTTTFTHNTPENRNNKTTKTKEFTLPLSGGQYNIVVNAIKAAVEEAPDAPSIKADITRVKLNIADSNSIKIPYRSVNSDKVIYTLGKTKRQIDTNGSLILKQSDFYNGVGNYTIYLQAVSDEGGSSPLEKISVTVESKAFLPGPDITTINYPQNIVGADFKGTNVPFEISWQSINTNFINIYAGRKHSVSSLGQFPAIGVASFNVGDILNKLNLAKIFPTEVDGILQFDLLLIPTNTEGNSKTDGKEELISISFDAGDLNLRRGDVISDLRSAFTKGFNPDVFTDSISPFLTHYLHLGDGNNKLIATWGIDGETLSTYQENLATNQKVKIKEEKSLVLKLYEPLPKNINPNDTIWLSKLQAIPIIDQITIVDDISTNCTPLTPNFALETNDIIGYQILDDLIASGSTTSTEIVNQFISSSEYSLDNLNINFVTSSLTLVETSGTGTYYQESNTSEIDWSSFVKYSSAEERVENFYYKVKLIQSYENRYNGLVSGSSIDLGSGVSSTITGSATSSVAIKNEAKRTLDKINDSKKGFDAFEKFLYTSSSVSGLTYPGAGGSALSESNDSSVTSWYNSIKTTSRIHDGDNSSRLVNNLPAHIQNDEEGQSFTLFFDMIGQHFDILWAHINGIKQTKKLEHKFENGINDKLIYHMLESLGWDADMGAQSQTLWEYAFGTHNANGDSHTDHLGNVTTKSSMSGEDRQNEIWRRLLNNLPYLHKHKGTKRAISAALSCYGIPQSLLTVMEFGGPRDTESTGTTKFTFEDRTASINFASSSNAITIPWKSHNEKYPDSVELRLNTDQKKDQRLISTAGWNLDIDYPESGSLAKLTLNILSGSTYVSSSTGQVAFFNDEYTQIAINRITGSGEDTIDVYLKEGFQGRIRNSTASSIKVPSSNNGWETGHELTIGGSTLTGSLDEFRLWSAPLSESVISNHTLLPDAINGNHIKSSTSDLIFRLDFEYPKDRVADTSIKNVSINTTYETFATASNFAASSTYPYHYTTYDRDVTAVVPSTGISFGNKVRFESQTKILDLSYRNRATKKSFDQSPLDSDRLGLFFSPIKEINMDIMKSLGAFNIDDYIGDPSDDYSSEYKELRDLRTYYFNRYNLNLSEYIQLVRYIDKSLFDVLESLVPARAKVSKGLLIEPHILERSKVEKRPTSASLHNHKSTIDTYDNINESATSDGISGTLTTSDITVLSGGKNNFEGTVSESISLSLEGTEDSYTSTIAASSDITQYGFITVNSGSDMGGISINVNAQFETSQSGEFDSSVFNQVGMDMDSLTVAGFSIYAQNGHTIITRLDKDNNFVKERKRVDVITESYNVDIPQNIDSNDESKGREFVTQTLYRKKLNFREFSQSGSLVVGNTISAVPLDGYVPYHYRNVGDLTTGMENSFFNGSKQTALTTLDGGAPVQTFTTNPNTLRVNPGGRGSGEPILEVD